MSHKLVFTDEAKSQLRDLQHDPDERNLAKLAKVRTCLGRLETNLRHPGLQSHEFTSLKGMNGEKVFEAYVENKTPGAWRVFWHYGRAQGKMTIAAITPHP